MTENLEQKGSGAKDADQQERPADGPAVAFGEPVRHEEADAGSQRCLCGGDQVEYGKGDARFSHHNSSKGRGARKRSPPQGQRSHFRFRIFS